MSSKELNATCLECGKKFHVAPSNLKRGCAKYCSWKCRIDYMKQHRFPAAKDKIEKKCEFCGKSFWVRPFRAKQKSCRFCSVDCMMQWRAVGFGGSNNPNFRNATEDRICAYCKQPFKVPLFKIRTQENRGKFCSKRCKDLAAIIPDSVGYRGDDWTRHRRLARQRDGYKCRVCGSAKTKKWSALPVHHIIPFRLFKYEFGKNENNVLANSPENLITLCTTHHGALEGEPIESFRPYLSESDFAKLLELQQFVLSLETV